MSIYVLLLVFVATGLVGFALVASTHLHGSFSLDTAFGVQNHHKEPTPRIGGVAVALGLGLAWVLSSASVRVILGPMLLAAIPAFAFGLAEDITKRVGVCPRLLATIFSGLLAWYLTGVAMQNTGFPPLDAVLVLTPIAVVFTAFAVGGVANAVNIIDGFNGLASGAVAIMLAAMGVIALKVGDTHLAHVCFLVATAALGFGAVNWPLGKIFLGDGGAYLLGFLLAWIAVLLPMRNPSVTAWTTGLVCAYPVLEVAFSVRRRQRRDGHHLGHPDKVHLHHLIHRRVVNQVFPRLSNTMRNGLTSPLCWVFAAVPAAWAVVFAQNIPMLVAALVSMLFFYSALYARLSQFRWCFGALTLREKPVQKPSNVLG